MRVYRCPNGCSISDEKKRCQTCGKWLLYDGDQEKEEIIKKTEEIQRGKVPSDKFKHSVR
jgi:hypothetical protein